MCEVKALIKNPIRHRRDAYFVLYNKKLELGRYSLLLSFKEEAIFEDERDICVEV